jgi:hypothetical protein
MERVRLPYSSVLLAAAVAGATPAAAEVLLTFGLEQRLEAGWNTDLSIPEGGRVTASVTRLRFGAISRTPLDVLEFSAASALVIENAEDLGTTETGVDRPDLALRYTREVPNALFSIGAAYREDDIDAFDDTLSADDSAGTRADTDADIRLETGRTAPLGFAISAAYARTEYSDTTDPDLIDSETVTVGLETLLRFSEVLQGRIGLSYAREEDADAPGVEVDTETLTFGMTYLMANGSATADLTLSSDDEEGDRTTFTIGRSLSLPAGSFSAQIGISDGDLGGRDLIGRLTWSQTLPRGVFDVLLERRIGFDESEVEAVTFTLASISLEQELGPVSILRLSLAHEDADAPSERSRSTRFTAVYSHELTSDWALNGGVRYRVSDGASGRSESPDIFLSLSRDFEFRP